MNRNVAKKLIEVNEDIKTLCRLRQNDSDIKHQYLYNVALTQLYNEKFKLLKWFMIG